MRVVEQQAGKVLPKNLEEDGLVSTILKLQVSRPESWDWKEDYATALEEKYENLYRR